MPAHKEHLMRNYIAAILATLTMVGGVAAAALLPIDASTYRVRYTAEAPVDEVCLFFSTVPEDAGLPAELIDRDGSGAVDKADAIACQVPDFTDGTTPNVFQITLEAPQADQPIAALAYRIVPDPEGGPDLELASTVSNVRDLLVQPRPVTILED